MLADSGLALFVLVVLADAMALVLDLCFLAIGDPTITGWLRRERRRGVAALSTQAAAVAGLALHLYAR